MQKDAKVIQEAFGLIIDAYNNFVGVRDGMALWWTNFHNSGDPNSIMRQQYDHLRATISEYDGLD